MFGWASFNMKILKLFILVLLLGSLTINAEPFKTWFWTGPDTYENGDPIIGDPLEYKLYCGWAKDGPYPYSAVLDIQAPPALQDMAFAVLGMVGVFFCVETAKSSLYLTESPFSNEVSFTVTPASRGFVPLPPILSAG